jgi:hypothetical protein
VNFFVAMHAGGGGGGLNVNKILQVCDRQLLASEIFVFTHTTVGTSHLWTNICLKDNNEV